MGHDEPQLSLFVALTTYFAYAVLIAFGHTRDFFGWLFGRSRYLATAYVEPGYAPLLKSWENFYTRRLYHRIQDCWNRPVASAPGAMIDVVERTTADGVTLTATGKTRRCLNLGSYNYLGFADDWQNTCRADVVGSLDRFGPSTCSAPLDFGRTALHAELEQVVADFVGKPAAMVFTMGYGTNTSTLPALVGKGDLIVSDALNHTSIVNGSRSSGAAIKVFRHNDAKHLERVLREAIAYGQARTHRPYKKILVVVEGIYSMEGEICELRPIVDVCKKYKAYIYVDEAHSIGALGATGRGVCEHCGVDPAEIDIMMGTFTKSFGGMGGYIAASADLITALRANSTGTVHSTALSPVVCQQVLTAFKIIQGKDGTDVGATKLRALRENSNYVRRRLVEMGLEVYGHENSPVIPVMLYNPPKIAAFSRECFDRNLAVVVVGFPATPLISSRTRICVSAAHTREQLEDALAKIDEVAGKIHLRYKKSMFG